MKRKTTILLTTLCLAASLAAQAPPKMRTRDITRLNQLDISEFMKRSDLLFVPVGSCEGNGVSPSDKDYVAALGAAMKMAEMNDGLYAPNLAYMYPGSTITSEATVHVSLDNSRQYIKTLAKSFLRQGFKTQVWVTMGHGPAPLIVGSMVREFFDETRVPILRLDAADAARRLKLERSRMIYGSYSAAGRIEDMPLASDLARLPRTHANLGDTNSGYATLTKMGLSGSMLVGFWWDDPFGHGGGNAASLPKTAEERTAWGKQGEKDLEALVKALEMPQIITALRAHAKFTHDAVVAKFPEKTLLDN